MMVRPTPGTESTTDGIKDEAATTPPRTTLALSDEQTRASEFLEMLGRSDHPDAATDPVYALYQVAVDFQCSAHGYRELYLRRTPSKD